jgi:predicted porin
MNYKTTLALCALTLSAHAHAQSTVTPYGVADTSLRYVTNATASGDSKITLANGGLSESLFGLRGTEDLGNQTVALFQ